MIATGQRKVRGETATVLLGTGAGSNVSGGSSRAGVSGRESAPGSIARSGTGAAGRGAGEGPGLFSQKAPNTTVTRATPIRITGPGIADGAG